MSVRELKQQYSLLLSYSSSSTHHSTHHSNKEFLEKKDLFSHVCQLWSENELKKRKKLENEREEKEKEKIKENIVKEMEKKTNGKNIYQLMNEILGNSIPKGGNGNSSSSNNGGGEYLTRSTPYEIMKKSYKKVVLRCHPDKLAGESNEKQLRATELFKIFIELWGEYKKKYEP